jgi:MoxR-like ATPase
MSNPLEAVGLQIASLTSELSETKLLLDEAKATSGLTGTLEVSISGTPTGSVVGAKHSMLPTLIKLAASRLPMLLVGSAGTGKTHAALQVSEALGLPFETISVGAQTSKSDLLGFITATGTYVPTAFRRCYESGGVYLMDELDAGNANVLTILNAALSNGSCPFPDKMITKHADFVFMGSANTFGLGASRQYVGRNQLDAATLDRFCTVSFDIDEKLEYLLSGAGSSDTASKWLATVRKVRSYVESEGIRALVTPRATYKGATMLDAGLDFDMVLASTILSDMTADKHAYVTTLAREAFDAMPVKGLVVNDPMGVMEPQARELAESPF